MKQRKRDLSNSRVSKEGDSSVNLTCETQLPYREFGRTNLVSEDVSVFFEFLMNPPIPTKRLQKAFAQHRALVNND